MSFQDSVREWAEACFGAKIADDQVERRYRFLEESLELFQATGGTRDQAIQLADYVFERGEDPIGREVGGVLLTLAALCEAYRIDMAELGKLELERAWEDIVKIREKQAAKTIKSDGNPLP